MANPVSGDIAAELPCHICGYDLRAHPKDGKCPECETSVAESRRLAAIPRRPAWRDTDPRWRRRILAGTWVLLLVPLLEVLKTFGWAARIPAPAVLDLRGANGTLDQTFLCHPGVYEPLVFCIGVVLLFARERGRLPHRLDWTRRWGVGCSYVVSLLAAAKVLFIPALVLLGVSAVFMSMPLGNQPGVTRLFATVSWAYVRYGPQPSIAGEVALAMFSSVAVLLACVPLFHALRSTGLPRRAAILLLAPLALFSLTHLAQVGRYCVDRSSAAMADADRYAVYFWPDPLVRLLASLAAGGNVSGSVLSPRLIVEVAKWCIVAGIAVWLSAAQLAVWWQRKKPGAA